MLSGSNCCNATGFHVFPRKADGTFGERQDYHVKLDDIIPLGRSRVLVTDWDGDGKPDLVFTVINRNKLYICDPLPDEKGRLSVKATWQLPDDQLMWGDLAVADWDGDGKPDLLLSHRKYGELGGIYWYRNVGAKGKPRFDREKGVCLVREADAEVLNGFTVADWNGDGRMDLLFTQSFIGRTPPAGKNEEFYRQIWLHAGK